MIKDVAKRRRIVGVLGLAGAFVIAKSLFLGYRHRVYPLPVRALKAWWMWRRITLVVRSAWAWVP